MFLAGGKLYFANTTNGNLSSVTWSNNQAVNGTRVTHERPRHRRQRLAQPRPRPHQH